MLRYNIVLANMQNGNRNLKNILYLPDNNVLQFTRNQNKRSLNFNMTVWKLVNAVNELDTQLYLKWHYFICRTFPH